VIFGHQHRNSQIDTEHVCVIPTIQRIEGIDEAVARPCLFTVSSPERAAALPEPDRQQIADNQLTLELPAQSLVVVEVQ
jgi:hypothetical protein